MIISRAQHLAGVKQRKKHFRQLKKVSADRQLLYYLLEELLPLNWIFTIWKRIAVPKKINFYNINGTSYNSKVLLYSINVLL